MNLPGKAFQPGFAIAALANLGAPDAIGPEIEIPGPAEAEGNCDPTLASTSHPGGIQVGLADGSVRTLSPSMSGFTWWSAVTPAGRVRCWARIGDSVEAKKQPVGSLPPSKLPTGPAPPRRMVCAGNDVPPL